MQLSLHSSRRYPLVIEVEDLHWIDATSEAWLAALAERARRHAYPAPGDVPTWVSSPMDGQALCHADGAVTADAPR
jgi:hypothetical protein